MTATTFAKGKNPFAPKPPPRPRENLDLAKVEKCRDPYTHERVSKQAKYDELFAGVKEGDCFKVHGSNSERSALARALRVYLDKHGIDGVVRQNGRTDDGIGRVWLVKVVGQKGGAA